MPGLKWLHPFLLNSSTPTDFPKSKTKTIEEPINSLNPDELWNLVRKHFEKFTKAKNPLEAGSLKLFFELYVSNVLANIICKSLNYELKRFLNPFLTFHSKTSFFSINRSCDELNRLQIEFVDQPEGALQHFYELLKFYEKFLQSSTYKTITFVLLWKLISKLPKEVNTNQENRKTDEIALIARLMTPFVRDHIDIEQKDGEKYTKFMEDLDTFTKHLSFVLILWYLFGIPKKKDF